jgi:hypothetical protein
MDTSGVVLALHLVSLLVLAGAIVVFGVCYLELRAAESGVDARSWTSLAGGPAGPSPCRSSGSSRPARI